MESCVDAMERRLAALARGELYQPLRSVVVRPASRLMGLMPAHRGGDGPAWALKEIVIFAGQPGPRARRAPGRGHAVRRRDRRAARGHERVRRSPRSAPPPCPGSATQRARAAGRARSAILGSGVQGRSHVEAMRAVLDDPRSAIWSRNRAHAEALALETALASSRRRSRRRSTAPTSSAPRRPRASRSSRREWLAPGAHVNAVGASSRRRASSTRRRSPRRRLFVDRRESTVNEAGDYLLAGRGAGHRPGPHRRRARRRAHRHRTRAARAPTS